MIIHMSVIRFWDPQLCLILLLLVQPFCVYRVSQPTTDVPAFDHDSFALVSQCDDRNCPRKSSKECHKCKYCHKLGHRINKCYALHDRLPRSSVVVQNSPS